MTDSTPEAKKPSARQTILVLFAVAVALGVGIAAGSGVFRPDEPPRTQNTAAVQGASSKPSEARGDAAAAYQEALASGKPVYLLFHSTTCKPCIEISGVVDQVLPGYADKLVFVNAITDDPGAQQLASSFKFQYIPQSFFIDSTGSVVDSYTGPLDATEMKSRLDKLTPQ